MRKRKKFQQNGLFPSVQSFYFLPQWYLVTALELVDPEADSDTEGNMGFICRSFNTRI